MTKSADGPHAGDASFADASGHVDDEPVAGNQRIFIGSRHVAIAALCVAYSVFHLFVMNVYPLETWTYRLIHVGGGLVLGFLIFGPSTLDRTAAGRFGALDAACLVPAGVCVLWSLGLLAVIAAEAPMAPDFVMNAFGPPLVAGTVLAVVHGWVRPGQRDERVGFGDAVLALAAVAATGYLVALAPMLQMRAGMPMAVPADMYAAIAGVILILELTRRLAGLALVAICGVFIAYAFLGPYLPGIFAHRGYDAKRFFSYIFTDNGVLSAPIAISSTYIILFVIFAAFLQATRVGEYFVNLAFAAAGDRRGGPAKVAIFASGLMGMINGTSAGNVVATGSLTIPLMKRVGYRPQTSAAVEAAASSGGQIMPPIMGAGAFIMAEITGIPYTEIVYAAVIPAIVYFLSVYFMVDLAAQKQGMRGLPRAELPKLAGLVRQIYLFTPIVVLIYALFAGYSVIRCGTLAMAAAAVVSWLTPHRMGPRRFLFALEMGARMSLQLVAVCAAAGIIVGVIALTGIGSRFSALLLSLANQSQLLALVFAMCVSIILGMGMPTTAAYAVAASVIAPGIVALGVEPLTAHFFIFYFAVMSAITPPVALAAYAGSALAKSNPIATSVESFKIGLAAFIVPYMFFYSGALLMDGTWVEIAHVAVTATVGVYLLSAAVQGWMFRAASWPVRAGLVVAAVLLIKGGWTSDLVGFGLGLATGMFQHAGRRSTAAA